MHNFITQYCIKENNPHTFYSKFQNYMNRIIKDQKYHADICKKVRWSLHVQQAAISRKLLLVTDALRIWSLAEVSSPPLPDSTALSTQANAS